MSRSDLINFSVAILPGGRSLSSSWAVGDSNNLNQAGETKKFSTYDKPWRTNSKPPTPTKSGEKKSEHIYLLQVND